MSLKTMRWDDRAWRAFARAFSPMPPDGRREAMRKVAAAVEHTAREKGVAIVGLEELLEGSRDILAAKPGFMYESLLEALASEGFIASKD